jgi:hypothetical protein
MWELIVMGQIPGTQIQVNFNTWLFAVFGAIGLWVFYKTARTVPAPHMQQRITMLRVGRIMRAALQDAAYTPLLAIRHHIQA